MIEYRESSGFGVWWDEEMTKEVKDMELVEVSGDGKPRITRLRMYFGCPDSRRSLVAVHKEGLLLRNNGEVVLNLGRRVEGGIAYEMWVDIPCELRHNDCRMG